MLAPIDDFEFDNSFFEQFDNLMKQFRKKVMNKNDLESVVKVYCQIYHYRLNKENTEEKI